MTAKELFSKHFDGLHWDDLTPESIEKYTIEFAKMHVENTIQEFKDKVNYGIYQNDDGQEPFHHESNIFIDFSQIDEQELIDNIK